MRVRSSIAFAVLLLVVSTASAAEKGQPSSDSVKRPVAREIVLTESSTPSAQLSPSSPNAELEVKWGVLAGGGKTVKAGEFQIGGTIGQASAGWSSGLKHDVHAGFWQNFTYTPCCENRGNVDHKFSGTSPWSIADLTYLVAMVFRGGADAPCMDEADITGDGTINVADVTFLVALLFRGGPEPGPC